MPEMQLKQVFVYLVFHSQNQSKNILADFGQL